MAKLEDIAVNVRVSIPTEQSVVTVIQAEMHGDASLEIVYKRSDGSVGTEVLFRAQEPEIHIEDDKTWSFEADADQVRITSEAYRISLAHLFDPYLAVRTSAIDPLPHQISAVYGEMLQRLPLRYVLADDPGAGKTIMAGLLIKEMMARGDLLRCMVVCPGSLVEQWQDELFRKFKLRFTILTNDCFEAAASGNAFLENDLCIARLDKLARNDDIQEKLQQSTWDLIICDEAHKMSASVFGNEVKRTKRYQLGQLLGTLTENLLLMTATPHNGKPQDFQLFMSLIDPDRFEGAAHCKPEQNSTMLTDSASNTYAPQRAGLDVSDVMRRLVKEELRKFDGTPLFPERIATTVNYSLSEGERELYEAVTEYVTEEFNRADKLDGKRKNSVGFALTTLQRRLASSPEAIYQSLRRRCERLEERLVEVQAGKPVQSTWTPENIDFDDYDDDDYLDEEREQMESEVSDTATAAATIKELEAEISTLEQLERKADEVRMSNEDHKWEELSRLLQDEKEMFDKGENREKLIIFTEHKDTLVYLQTKITQLLGSADMVLTIQGGMSRDARHIAEERFIQDKNVRILVATDAAGEGINLQRAHLMINYDLPWNPNRLEQRFGRIHRIGQTEVCHLWNLVSQETREGAVYTRLLDKLNEERKALGGRVFDILGQVTFDNKPLRDLLMEAIRYGNSPEARERLHETVDTAVSTEELKKLLERYALTQETMLESDVESIREDMERAEARKLEPHFIEEFFLEALRGFGGRAIQRETGRYEILDVPSVVRNHGNQGGWGDKVLPHYERVCFTKGACEMPGYPAADLVCPGHPLLDAVISALLTQNEQLLKQGCIFIDELNSTTTPRLLLYIETVLQDGIVLSNGNKRCASRELRFVEIDEAQQVRSAGYAPYLDYNSPDLDELQAIRGFIDEASWLKGSLEDLAKSYAMENIVPQQLAIEKQRRDAQAKKSTQAVRERLTDEIRYWERRSRDSKEKEKAGKSPRITSINADAKAQEFTERLQERLDQIERERQITALPPHVVGAALVVPRSFVEELMGEEPDDEGGAAAAARKRIEMAGMNAVMQIERKLGNDPKDVSAENVGWDIESRVSKENAEGGSLLKLIEVKGRALGAKTITVTKNEVLHAMNDQENFILAIVEVDENTTNTTYVKHPFTQTLDFAQVNGSYDIQELKESKEVLLEREQTWQ